VLRGYLSSFGFYLDNIHPYPLPFFNTRKIYKTATKAQRHRDFLNLFFPLCLCVSVVNKVFVYMEKIVIASDHGGFELKEDLKLFLTEMGYEPVDFGTENSNSVDYPDFGAKVAEAVARNEMPKGILICGTGIGMSIVVNRFPGVRGALCNDVYSARMSREHNDSNVLILGGRVVGKGLAREMVKTWINTKFEGGRHQKRLDKIKELEDKIRKGEI
jgi:ribose 5-phosphate isomerase B